MIASALGIIKNELQTIDVPYEYMRWTSPVIDRYWISEYSETPTDTEDGAEEYTLMLTGTTRTSWLELEQDRATIRDHFPAVGGFRQSTGSGVVVIFFENSFPVPTDEADLKRIQVNLKIKAWKGMN